ncbi:MAG: hypothetical protein HC915_15910 [Anaerolineae bacterium]|nr:hypothetical protein [Anaerolineae bacterium]
MSDLPNINQPPQQQPLSPLPPQRSSGGTRSFILILLGLLVICICLVPIVVIVVLALLGPAIGNVFSEIEQSLITPAPGFILLFFR